MKRFLIISLVFVATIGINCDSGPKVVANGFMTKADMQKSWATMSDYTIKLADRMPAEYYEFTVDQEVRSFGEQMVHIIESNFLLGEYLKAVGGKKLINAKTKGEIMEQLKESFSFVSTALGDIKESELYEEVDFINGDNRTRFMAYMYMVDHLTHTRGISLSYLRSKSIAPPIFRSW